MFIANRRPKYVITCLHCNGEIEADTKVEIEQAQNDHACDSVIEVKSVDYDWANLTYIADIGMEYIYYPSLYTKIKAKNAKST